MRLLVLILSLFFLGCAKQVEVKPQFTNVVGNPCASDCQSPYTQCKAECSSVGIVDPGPLELAQRSLCLNNCQHALNECYTACREAPEQ